MKVSSGLILFSLLIGVTLFISKALAVCILLTCGFFHFVLRKTDERDRSFVVFIMALAMILRIIAFIFMQYWCFSSGNLDLLGDAQDNLEQGISISDSLKSLDKSDLAYKSLLSSRYNTHAKTFFNGIFFLFLGKDVVSLKYLNFLAILLTGWLIYDFTKKFYSSLAGRSALAIVLFWPTLFIWSLMDLKESHLVMSLVCAFWFLDRFRSSDRALNRFIFLTLSVLFSAYFVSLKIKLLLPIFFISVSFIISYYALLYVFSKGALLMRKTLYIGLVFLSLVVTGFGSAISRFIEGVYSLVIHYHIGFLDSGGWNVDIIGDRTQDFHTLQFFAKYFIKAWIYFLFDPLPWHFYSLGLMAVYPVLLVWYLLLFFSVLGLIRLYRAGRGPEIFAMIIFTFIYVTVVGMSVANIGTMIRFRDAILPVVAVFSSVGVAGLWEERCRTIR